MYSSFLEPGSFQAQAYPLLCLTFQLNSCEVGRIGQFAKQVDEFHVVQGAWRSAGDSGITLYIGTDDDFHGYVVHIEDVCVDPDLVDLYWDLHNKGRKELPALKGHQAFGKAINNEIKVAVRDTGSFLDPRSRNDWWRGR